MLIVLITLLVAIAGSLLYVYRYRGSARYADLREYFRKGWPIFSPLNCLLYLTTQTRGSGAILDADNFPQLAPLKDNWETIRDEAVALHEQHYFDLTKRPGTPAYYDVGFRTFFKYGWSRFYLHWYGYTHHSARALCPKTVSILARVPSLNGAMFALLPPGSQLSRHADPMACSLRYHLGLATPNSDTCFINIDGRDHSWRDGKVLMFDETYLHYARNDSDQPRLILMCDINRPTNALGTLVNFLYKSLPRLSVVPNTEVDHRGFANRVFSWLSPLLGRSKALKQANRPLYLALKYSVNTLLLLIVLSLLALLVNFTSGIVDVAIGEMA
jgi:beta-hydroxylase